MGRVNYSVTTSLLMRVGNSKVIQKCYDEKTIQFGCAANWLDYALKYKNQAVGDYYECVFAHIPKGDARVNSITDIHGKPMGDHLLILENQRDGSSLLRLIPTILMPTICFFSFNVQRIRKQMDKEGEATKWFAFDLDAYREDMEYQDDASFLFITDPVSFFQDLKESIPISVEKNKKNLTSKRFYSGFNPQEPFIFRDVDYHHYTDDRPFFDYQDNREELFWKLPKYEQQSELRIAISHLNFVQTYDPSLEYDYNKNKLDIFLPHFQEYAMIVPASKAHSLYFGGFDTDCHTNDFAVLELTMKDIQDNIKANRGKLII